MSAEPAHWGVPEFPSTVTRQGLLRLMENSPEEILVLAAPSGHGKTVAASQYARCLNRPVLWIAVRGQGLTMAGIAQALVESVELMLAPSGSPKSNLTQGEDSVAQARNALAVLGHSGVVLVLDDISSPKNGDAVSSAGELLMTFRPLISRVVLTTRQSPRAFDARLSTPAILGQHELAFSLAEAHLMASHYGLGADDLTLVDELHARSGGHAALLRLMLTLEQSPAPKGEYGAPALAAQVLVEQLIDAHLSESERPVMEAVSLLKAGDASDLEALGLDCPRTHLKSIAASLPLVRLDVQDPGKSLLFEAHDLLSDCVLESMGRRGTQFLQRDLDPVLGILARRSRWSQAGRVLSLVGDDETTLDFIEKHGGDMMGEQRADDVLALINEVSLQSVMSRPRCLFLWAQALHEVGEVRESVAKSAASIRLAQHERDYDTLGLAVSQRIQAWLDQGRAEESVDSAEEILGDQLRRMSPAVRFELLTSYATALGVLERRDESERAFDQAQEAAVADRTRSESLLNCLRRVKAYLNPLWTGDYATGVRELSPLLNDNTASFLIRRSMRGNLAWMLMETGRLNRAEALLQSVFSPGHDILEASYLPIYGLILGARGEYALALQTIRRSQAAAASYDDEADLHVNRLYQASVERAAGMTEQSLDSAERSFEGLSERDFIGQLRLATAEVGASLLALGDSSAARAWVGDDLAVWPAANKYHALCGAMVLAVIEHREGDTAAAVDLLTPFAPYIRSESANWRMAMYCRTFPELLGLLSAAVGADNLPIHMLRMLLPENAERGLRDGHTFLSDEDWQALGRRALGEEQFTEYLERKGRPICRVRLFGGLEVNVEDRIVCERDWTKRKARLLFAMLVVRRGQDVPRDQILEHLWPELDDGKARNNFYVIWSTMKSALMGPDAKRADCPYVESKRGRCRIVREAVRSDVDEFEELIAAARHAESSGDTEGAKAALSELMNVYRGDLLPGDVYDDWFAALRDKYRLLFVDAMLKGVDLLLEQDNPCEAVLFARQGLNSEPHREDLYQAALKCYISAGQRSSAIEAFIQCKAHLAENLGLDPSAETLELYQQVLAMEERPRRDSYGLNAE